MILLWAAVGVLIVSFYLLLRLLGRRYPAAAAVSKVLPVAVAAVAVPVALLVVINFARDFFPGHVFKSSFGFAAPPDVVDLQGRRFYLGDGGDAYLRFRASKTTVDQIVAGRFDEVPGDGNRCNQIFAAGQLPRDWQPPTGEAVHCFRSLDRKDGFGSGFSSNSASLIYDPRNGTVYYYWSGID